MIAFLALNELILREQGCLSLSSAEISAQVFFSVKFAKFLRTPILKNIYFEQHVLLFFSHFSYVFASFEVPSVLQND